MRRGGPAREATPLPFDLPSFWNARSLAPARFFALLESPRLYMYVRRTVYIYILADIRALKKLIKILREDRVRMKVSMRNLGQNCGESGGHESMRGVFRGCQLIYKVSCHSHARQQQTIHLYVQHRNRVTRKVTRAEAIDHLLSATLTLLGDYQQGQRNEGVSMIARDNSTYNSSYHVRRKKKGKKKQ